LQSKKRIIFKGLREKVSLLRTLITYPIESTRKEASVEALGKNALSAAIIKASLRQQIQATSYKSKRKAPHKPIPKTKYFRQKPKQEGFLQ